MKAASTSTSTTAARAQTAKPRVSKQQTYMMSFVHNKYIITIPTKIANEIVFNALLFIHSAVCSVRKMLSKINTHA